MFNAPARAWLLRAASIALALLLAGCAADQLKATAAPEQNTSFAAPHALHEVTIEFVTMRPRTVTQTYGSMHDYKKKASRDFVERVVTTAAQVLPATIAKAFGQLSVGHGARYKLTITPVDAFFFNESGIGTFNAAGRVVFSVVLTDSADRKLWAMSRPVVAEKDQDLSEPLGALAKAVMYDLIVQGWVQATPAQVIAFASVEDVDALPSNRPGVKNAYREWLKKKTPRAFVLTDDGHYNAASGGIDPAQRAMAACHARPHANCFMYAVDNSIVYTP